VKRGLRIVHGDKELIEKLGRRDPCPCGSGRRFQGLLPDLEPVSSIASIISVDRPPFEEPPTDDHRPEAHPA
jgi:hypothetical protein